LDASSYLGRALRLGLDEEVASKKPRHTDVVEKKKKKKEKEKKKNKKKKKKKIKKKI